MTRIACAVAALVLLAACGGGGGAEPDPTPTSAEPSEPTAVDLRGTPAPEALSGFRCEEIDDVWKAVGTVKNTTKEQVTFQVTLYIGPGDGAPHEATTQQLRDVKPGDSAEFGVEEIPVSGEGPCRVQVLRSQG